MEIIDVRLWCVEIDGRMKVIFLIMIDGEFVIYDICVIDGNEGLFVVMFSKCMLDGEFRDIVYLINLGICVKI